MRFAFSLHCSLTLGLAAVIGLAAEHATADDSGETSADTAIPDLAVEDFAPPLAAYFGFMPVEVYKVDDRAHAMVVGDFDDDGLNDIAVADDAHSRIALLLQRSSPADEPETSTDQVNAISSDWRFRLERLPVDRAVIGIVAGDFDNDGRDDLAWLGSPDRLTIKRQTAEGGWEALEEFRVPDLSSSGQSLAAGDLNGDGLADIVALGTNVTYLSLQGEGGMAAPISIRNTSENVRGAMIQDLNGDGRLDLLYGGTRGDEFVLGMRFQSALHELGPETTLNIDDIRVATAGDLTGDSQAELLLVDSLTERLQIRRWQPVPETALPLSSPMIYGYGKPGNTEEGDLVVGDIDGDDWVDVIVSDPSGAELIVYRGGNGGLDQGTTYPCLEGVNHLRMTDVDADGILDLVVLSPQEHVLGISRFVDDRLEFPTPLPLGYEPVVMDLADVNGDGVVEIVALGQEQGGRSANTLLVGRITTQSWEALINPTESELELRGDAHRLTHGDFDHDGRDEIVVTYEGNREPQVFRFDDSFTVTEVTSPSGTGIGEIEITEMFVDHGADAADSLLTANETYARRLAWEPGAGWRIVEQFNAVGGSPRVTRAITLDVDPAEGREIILWDDTAHALRLFRNEEGVSRQYDQIEIGAFPLASMQARDINRDGKDDLLLVGTSQFAVSLTGVQQGTFEEVASYENADPEEVLFGDLIVGDINSDGLPEPVLIDVLRHSIEIVASRPEWNLEWGLTFRVFEEKSFNGGGSVGQQPREVLIADVTGDGANDLILLTHDRVLVYPQDTGEEEVALEETAGQ